MSFFVVVISMLNLHFAIPELTKSLFEYQNSFYSILHFCAVFVYIESLRDEPLFLWRRGDEKFEKNNVCRA